MLLLNYIKLFGKIGSGRLPFAGTGNARDLPYKVNFNLTDRCNARCRICNIWKICREDPGASAREMSLDEYRRLFRDYGRSLFMASFEGGEPFLREDLSEIVAACLRECPNCVTVLLDSNGLLPEVIEKRVRAILSLPFDVPVYIAFSLDGLEAVHDRMRGVPGGFRKLMESVRRLRTIGSRRLKIYFQTTISGGNWRTLLDFYRGLEERVIFTLAHEAPLFRNAGNPETVDRIPEREEFHDFLRSLYRAYRVRGPVDWLNRRYLGLSIRYLERKKTPVPCVAGRDTLIVDPYGNVSPCSFLGESPGNIREFEFHMRDLVDSPAFRNQIERIKRGECPQCWMNCDALPSLLHHFPG
jgi:MoaA/NifB/PqqE/SkfB family radical SAM enzyme